MDKLIQSIYGNIFKEDEEWFNKYAGQYTTSDSQNISENILHTNFYPEQIVGNPNTARIFLLNMNPSFDPSNQTTQLELQDELLNNILGVFDSEYPFHSLNPKYENTDGCRWWRNGRHFGGWEKYFTLSELSKAFCNLELLPYHCKNLPAVVRNNIKECPSTKAILDFVHTEVVPKAKAGEAAIILLRCSREWELEEDISNNIFLTSSPRSAYFGPNMYFNTDTEKQKLFFNTIDNLINLHR